MARSWEDFIPRRDSRGGRVAIKLKTMIFICVHNKVQFMKITHKKARRLKKSFQLFKVWFNIDLSKYEIKAFMLKRMNFGRI